MSEWQPIESAPRDGSVVRVRRIYEGRLVKEGDAVFDLPHPQAPMLSPIGSDLLRGLRPEDCAALDATVVAAAETRRWLLPDRMYAFPTPTHWRPCPATA